MQIFMQCATVDEISIDTEHHALPHRQLSYLLCHCGHPISLSLWSVGLIHRRLSLSTDATNYLIAVLIFYWSR